MLSIQYNSKISEDTYFTITLNKIFIFLSSNTISVFKFGSLNVKAKFHFKQQPYQWQFTCGSIVGTDTYQTTAEQKKNEPGIHAYLENRESC